MTYPWMKSRYKDKETVCMLCNDPIDVNEDRMYNMETRQSAHVECVGVQATGGHGHARDPAKKGREEAIKEMHDENYNATKELTESIRALRATLQGCTASLLEVLKHE